MTGWFLDQRGEGGCRGWVFWLVWLVFCWFGLGKKGGVDWESCFWMVFG